jgi:hypothetical protein
MIWRIKRLVWTFAFLTPFVSAWAHGKGPNNGQYVHIGNMHTEFVQMGGEWRFFVSDESEKPVDTDQATAEITILDQGISRKIRATPLGKNILTARIDEHITKGAKLVIMGTLKDKRTFIGRFEVK